MCDDDLLFERYLPVGMEDTMTAEREVRQALVDAAHEFIRHLERPISCQDLDIIARPLIVLVEQGRIVLDRHEHAQVTLEAFRNKCKTFVPSSPEDMFSSTQT
jgi:hypothetical protein